MKTVNGLPKFEKKDVGKGGDPALATAAFCEWLVTQRVVLLLKEDTVLGNEWVEPAAGLPLGTTQAAYLIGIRRLG